MNNYREISIDGTYIIRLPVDKRIVATNGCFDILHAGHVEFLQRARSLGDFLIVGLNSDRAVRKLKGEGRPVNDEKARGLVLGALGCVDAVALIDDVNMASFLSAIGPNIWAKGGDYSIATLNKLELDAVISGGGIAVIIQSLPGYSTTAILTKAVCSNSQMRQ